MTLHNPVTQVLLPLLVVVVMFALGTSLTLEDLARVLRRPRGFFVGVVVHALLFPLLAFALALGLGLPRTLAVGLVLIASCPAAAPASLFTHAARGDTMLCVCLTAAASLTSVVTLPLFMNAALGLFSSGQPAGAPLRRDRLPRSLRRLEPARDGGHALATAAAGGRSSRRGPHRASSASW